MCISTDCKIWDKKRRHFLEARVLKGRMLFIKPGFLFIGIELMVFLFMNATTQWPGKLTRDTHKFWQGRRIS